MGSDSDLTMEEDQEGARVLGLGVGLFLIILVWSLTLAAVLLLSRMATGSSLSLVSLAILVTAILLVIPREEKITEEEVVEEPRLPTDGMFIWRMMMVAISAVFSLLGVILVTVDFGMHTVKPATIKIN